MVGRAASIVSIVIAGTLLAIPAAAAAEPLSRRAAERPSRPAAPPPPSPTMLGTPWYRVPGFPGPLDSSVNGIFRTRFGLVAAGARRFGEAAIWTSPNGDDWVRVRGAAMFDETEATGGIDTPSGAIVYGTVADLDTAEAAMWRSVDGATWVRVDGGRAFKGGQMSDAVRGGPGYVIVGSNHIEGRSVVWTSVDGATWRRVPRQAALELTQMLAVARYGELLVAVGWRFGGEPTAAVWTSRDGLAWEHAADLSGGTLVPASSIAVHDGRLVVGGSHVEQPRGFLWTSSAGLAWERVAFPDARRAGIFGLAARDGRFVAVGYRNGDDAGVWTSSDGSSWTVLDDGAFTDAAMTSIVPFGGGFVAGGLRQERVDGTGSYDRWAAVWRRP